MYGIHKTPLSLSDQNINLSFRAKDGALQYERQPGDKTIEKSILAGDCSVLINPIEPLNTPKDLTPYLLIRFGSKLILEPKSTSKVYLKFPIEIGIFTGKSAKSTKDFHLMDVFSLDPGKYALYGDIRTGILCKYYESDIFMSLPDADPLLEGILELTIYNRSDKWTEVSKAVFNAYLMKLYYSQDKVGMKASMLIMDGDTAETSFSDSPLEKGMKKAVEHYVTKGLIMTASSFVMEWGYVSE